MVVVKIELWPKGDSTRAKEIGRVEIANTGEGGTGTRGNYTVRTFKSLVGKGKSLWREGRVEGFPRKQLGPYDLLFRALRALVADRNKE